MKKIIFILLVLASFHSLAQTQTEMNLDADKKYKLADTKLNNVYIKIIKLYTADTSFIKNLEISQRLWIQFRDAELKMKYPDSYSYGSVQPMCISIYSADLTNDRIKTLQAWLDGIEEGDVCAGSIKTKN